MARALAVWYRTLGGAPFLSIWLAALSTCESVTLQAQTRIVDEQAPTTAVATTVKEMAELPKVGDGPGRPLYAVNTIELPESRAARHCVTMRLDRRTHAVTVDTKDRDINSVAFGCYEDRMNTTGWNSLQVTSTADSEIPLALRAWGAGLIEGLLTCERTVQFHQNFEALYAKDMPDAGAKTAVERVIRTALIAWEEYAGGDAAVEPEDDVSKQAWAALIQMRGIRDGYNFEAARLGYAKLSALNLMMMNMHAEIPSIVELYGRSEQAKVYSSLLQTSARTARASASSDDRLADHALNTQSFLRYTDRASASSHAGNSSQAYARWSRHRPGGSALVSRVGPLDNPEDILAGHVTFGDYGEMTRIVKNYNLHFETMNSGVTISSYPGCISSTDDYFITDRGFVLMSTNLWVPDSGEYSLPARTNDGLPAFLRAMIATRLATQPRSWARLYGFVNGIAGAKQWLIVDYGKLKPGQPIANETVWLVESLPRLQRAGDVSQALRDDGFFEAHGIPHFRQIREVYGFQPFGPGTYEEHRQSALLEKAETVTNLASARGILSEVGPSRRGQIPINTRNDLDPERPVPAGGIDAKVTSKCLASKMALEGRSGPPASDTAFRWQDESGGDAFPGWPHLGLADEWNFEWTSLLPDMMEYPATPGSEECDSGE